MILTKHEMNLLLKINVRNGCYVRGSEIQTARRLVIKGLVKLQDEGSLAPGGRSDGERWWATTTAVGRKWVDSYGSEKGGGKS